MNRIAKSPFLTWPNLLTLFRLFSAPIFLTLFIGSGEDGFLLTIINKRNGLIACLIVLILSELSDILDGILARRLNQVSNFGKLLDPYADSMFRLTCYFAFASHAHGKWVPIWMVMLLLYRDLLVTIIRAFGIERRIFVHARPSGKIKAVIQGSVVFITLLSAIIYGEQFVAYKSAIDGVRVTALAHILMWIVTLVTIWSAIDYLWGNRHLFREQTN